MILDQMAKMGSLFFVTFSIFFPIVLSTPYAINGDVPALFFFGDSVLDAGTNVFLPNSTAVANFPPYGETYFHKPTGRFSNGRTIADFLVLALNVPLVKPYLDPQADHRQGANFASAASGLLDSTLSTSGVVPFKQQIRQFQQLAKTYKHRLGHSVTQKLISNSLFVMSSGGNDIGWNYLRNSTFQQIVTVEEFMASLMQIFDESIKTLYLAGARKFVVLELGMIGCYPVSRMLASFQNQTGCLTGTNRLALMFNADLGNLLINLTSTLPHASIVYGKTFNMLSQLINHGEQYGFVISTVDACCGAGPFNALVGCGKNVSSNSPYKVYIGKFPSKYLFWDNGHLTEAANRIIFKWFWNGNTSYIEPFNIYSLIIRN